MKKFIVTSVVSLSVFLFSCSSEDRMLSKLEDELVKNLKDPNSYERIEARLDTFYLIEQLRMDSSLYQIERKYDKVEQITKVLVNTDPKEIKEIAGVFKYRAKNGFGALGIETSRVWYDPKKDVVVSIR